MQHNSVLVLLILGLLPLSNAAMAEMADGSVEPGPSSVLNPGKTHLDLIDLAFQSNPANSCDLNSDGKVDAIDGQLAVNMSLGQLACTANIEGAAVCNSDMATRVIVAALGLPCITGISGGVSHGVAVSWTASGSPNITGYNVYRGSASGGPYTKATPTLVPGTTFLDTGVQKGQTYYYVVTAVDNTSTESSFSGQAQAGVPTP